MLGRRDLVRHLGGRVAEHAVVPQVLPPPMIYCCQFRKKTGGGLAQSYALRGLFFLPAIASRAHKMPSQRELLFFALLVGYEAVVTLKTIILADHPWPAMFATAVVGVTLFLVAIFNREFPP